MPKTVVILGGGIGGIATARALRRRLPRQHRIVLVDREREQVFAPSLLWLMVGQRDAASIRRPLNRLGRKGIAHAITGRGGSKRFDGYGECFIEVGGGKAGFGGGNFYAEPAPAVNLKMPSRRWHIGKVLFEKTWLYLKL
jgi:NADPH-dependent 2,4-dienoyl-CoA reductase/sulfur reductase-like enzyme